MQVPSNIPGLRQVLRSLGYGDVLTGLDPTDPCAKQQCREQIEWMFSESEQNMQDKARMKKAISYIERFPGWGSSDEMQGLNAGLDEVLKAVDELHALLEEEQLLYPVEVEEIIEDENGDAEAIVVDTTPDEALRVSAFSLLEVPDDPS
jgi:hypothetical protein